jgi:hypothetical protein
MACDRRSGLGQVGIGSSQKDNQHGMAPVKKRGDITPLNEGKEQEAL